MAPKRFLQLTSFTIILICALTFGLLPASAEAAALPDLNSFAQSVDINWPGIVAGVYVQNDFALPVVQQPASNPAFVSSKEDVLTEFSMVRSYGNVGLLAHNHLAGKNFSMLELGEQVQIVYGNGEIETFVVSKIYRFQALTPNSPYTNFVDLETGEKMDVTTVFNKVYTGERHVTFQTCIAQGDELSWGRLFIIAEPLPPVEHAEFAGLDR